MTSVWLSSASEPGCRVRLCPVRTPCGGFEPHCLVALLPVGVSCPTGSLFVRLTPFPSGGSWSAFEVRGAVSLRGWSHLAVVQVGAAQAQPGPSRQVQQQTGSQPYSRVRRRFRRSRRLTEQRQLPVESVQQPGVQPQQQSQRLFSGRCYRVLPFTLS
ncbi:hypothetical protein Taro_038228 [Colocasia esculenta]|uniref:Uncharacterized protein n=1 Tax=Colocasia esculenta TaxID=4460 RepID=A0A843WC64_COLES|nr:hypothetical protein [Colocasia esculenta]